MTATGEETEAQRTKLEAEARHFNALADYYEERKREVEYMTRQAEAHARVAEIEADTDAINLERKREDRKKELAADVRNHVLTFYGDVNSGSVTKALETLTEWTRTDPRCDIEIIFNSPGGALVAGMALFDFIQALRDRGHRVTTSAIGKRKDWWISSDEALAFGLVDEIR